MIPQIDYSPTGLPKTDFLKGIGSITYYKKFAYIKIDEGAHLGFIEMEKIHSLTSYHYKDQSYAYMCNRTVSYSVDPIAYTILNNMDRLQGIAIIKNSSSAHDLQVERHFVKKPFEVFTTFEKGVDWIDSII